MVAESNADDNYQARGMVTRKLLWAKQIWELKFGCADKMNM